MVKSKLPNNVLGKIWKLSDVDKDGMLDADEFSLAMHLLNVKLDGHDLPGELPKHLMPPSKRGFWWDSVIEIITFLANGYTLGRPLSRDISWSIFEMFCRSLSWFWSYSAAQLVT